MNRTRCSMLHFRLMAMLLIPVLIGCSDVLGSQEEVEQVKILPPGIHPTVVIGEENGAATLELHLRRVGIEEKIASFQGELRYDGALLTLAKARVADGITGATNEVSAGVVRFAGVSLSGAEDGAVLILTFDGAAQPQAEAFEVRMEEVTSSENFVDMTSRVIQAGGASPVASEASERSTVDPEPRQLF